MNIPNNIPNASRRIDRISLSHESSHVSFLNTTSDENCEQTSNRCDNIISKLFN
jgi:hypothetical protein